MAEGQHLEIPEETWVVIFVTLQNGKLSLESKDFPPPPPLAPPTVVSGPSLMFPLMFLESINTRPPRPWFIVSFCIYILFVSQSSQGSLQEVFNRHVYYGFKKKRTMKCLYQKLDVGEAGREKAPMKSRQKAPRLLVPYAN